MLQTPRKAIAAKFNVSPSTIGHVLRNRSKFEARLSQGINRKRKRDRPFLKTADLNDKVIQMVDKCNAKGIPVSGVQIREAAKEIASKIGVQDFTASPGWLQKLQDRHELSFKTVCGESAGVDQTAANRWMLEVLPNIAERGFSIADTFSVDEFGMCKN